MREYKSLLGKTLYNYGTSTSPMKRAISTGILRAMEASGSKERTTNKILDETKLEREGLQKFLNGKVTKNTLEKLGVNSRTFNIVVFREYPFNTGKYDKFLRAFIILRNELREYTTQNKKLNPSKYEDIIKRMIKYEKGNSITSHNDYIPLVISSEKDSDEYSDSENGDGSVEDLARKNRVASQGSGISDYVNYLDGLSSSLAERETLTSRENSLMRSVNGELGKMQVGGFCYRETSKLKDILRGSNR